jgi:hypothetical protein
MYSAAEMSAVVAKTTRETGVRALVESTASFGEEIPSVYQGISRFV